MKEERGRIICTLFLLCARFRSTRAFFDRAMPRARVRVALGVVVTKVKRERL